MTRVLTWFRDQPWIWSFLGALAVWLVIVVAHGQGGGATLTMTLNFSVFFVIVGIGQMLVITIGPGNIDLSIPATMALGGAIAMKVMNGVDSGIALGLLYTLVTGVAIGVFNFGLIWLLRIPPIIATLSSNFIVLSVAISYGRGLRVKPPAAFSDFTSARILGLPIMALVTILFAIGIATILARTIYGRSVTAIGQSTKAARLAGIKVNRTRLITYTISAALSAIAGALLAGFSGGSALDLGAEYLMGSISVVVLGGTSVAGGKSNVPGIWGAAMFLYLLVAMLNTFGIGMGLRLVLTGICIVAVITIGGGEKIQ